MGKSSQVLLLEDVEFLGKQGEIVRVKSGFARNFLFPKRLAKGADKNILRLQATLREKRAKIAEEERKNSKEIAEKLEGVILTISVKIDETGHLYGSVAAGDLINKLEEETKIKLEKSAIVLKHPIKALGVHTISIKLKEGVTASFTLKVIAEQVPDKKPEG